MRTQQPTSATSARHAARKTCEHSADGDSFGLLPHRSIDTITVFKLVFQAGAFLLWMRNRKWVPDSLRPITWFMVLSFIAENWAMVLSRYGIDNTLLYKIWIPVMVTVLSYWLIRSLHRSWQVVLVVVALIVYFGLVGWESANVAEGTLLYDRSLLFGYAFLSITFAARLLHLAASSVHPLIKDPVFWVLVAFFASLGPAIPYLGLLNHLYAQNKEAADSLYVIVEVLFLLQFVLLGVAALLFPSPQQSVAHGRP